MPSSRKKTLKKGFEKLNTISKYVFDCQDKYEQFDRGKSVSPCLYMTFGDLVTRSLLT